MSVSTTRHTGVAQLTIKLIAFLLLLLLLHSFIHLLVLHLLANKSLRAFFARAFNSRDEEDFFICFGFLSTYERKMVRRYGCSSHYDQQISHLQQTTTKTILSHRQANHTFAPKAEITSSSRSIRRQGKDKYLPPSTIIRS